MVLGTICGAQSGAQLRLGPSHRLHAESLGQADLFLRQAGAPLDNNLCERALKKAILHRKNALFYKTQNGAHVGDLLMSLIYACQLCGANAFEYLTELQQHGEKLSCSPPAMDALELPRDAGAVRCKRGFRVEYDESRLAGNNRFRPYTGATRRWPENRPLAKPIRSRFLARGLAGGKLRAVLALYARVSTTEGRLCHSSRSSSRDCQILRLLRSPARQVLSLQSRLQKKRCSADLPS